MRTLIGALVLAVAATTVSAQGGGAGGAGGMGGMAMGGGRMDMTNNHPQTGPLPAGWQVRVDFPERNEKAENLNFVAMGPGFHVSTGPHGSFWNPANTASGKYTVTATFEAKSMPAHDAVGILWGGSDLTGDKENYAYFLIFGDGNFAVKHRSSSNSKTASARNGNSGDVHTVIDKTPNDAIKKAMKDGVEADGGSATNKLEVRVAPDSVRFVVNGTQVAAVDAKSPMMPSSGIYGFRVAHNVDVHIADFGKK